MNGWQDPPTPFLILFSSLVDRFPEMLPDLLQVLSALGTVDHVDCQALFAEATRPTDAMEVRLEVRLFGLVHDG